MSSISSLIGGAFAFMEAPFGLHPRDRERAAEYLVAALEAGLTWADAEQDIRDYGASKGWKPAEVQKQVDRGAKLLRPWLE